MPSGESNEVRLAEKGVYPPWRALPKTDCFRRTKITGSGLFPSGPHQPQDGLAASSARAMQDGVRLTLLHVLQ
jgi:hypothetical protein